MTPFHEDGKRLGWTIYPFSSFLNHSCYPNTEKIFIEGPKLILYAKRPIKKNEQVSIKKTKFHFFFVFTYKKYASITLILILY